MNPKRRVDICGSCGDEAEIAAHGTWGMKVA